MKYDEALAKRLWETDGTVLYPARMRRLRVVEAAICEQIAAHNCEPMSPIHITKTALAIVDALFPNTGKVFQCWKAHTDEAGAPHTCLLPDLHDGDCEWTADDDIYVVPRPE